MLIILKSGSTPEDTETISRIAGELGLGVRPMKRVSRSLGEPRPRWEA